MGIVSGWNATLGMDYMVNINRATVYHLYESETFIFHILNASIDSCTNVNFVYYIYFILNIHLEMVWLDLWQLLLLKTLVVGHGRSSADSYLANPTSPSTVL